MIDSILISIYRSIFARPLFYKFNKLILRLSLSGIGVLNYRNEHISGERSFASSVLKQAPKRPVVIDIGANIGDYCRMLRTCGPEATIYAFEPHPATFMHLKNNVGSFAQCINLAVGESSGTLELFDYKDNDGSQHASIFKDVIEGIHMKEAVAHQVGITTLDDFIAQNGIAHIDLLKIDTEGNELGVLRGATNALRNGLIDRIQIEFNEMNVSSKTFFRDFWNMLPNYKLYRLLPNSMVHIETYFPIYCEIFAFQNIVAIRKDLTSAQTVRE